MYWYADDKLNYIIVGDNFVLVSHRSYEALTVHVESSQLQFYTLIICSPYLLLMKG